VWQFWWSLRPYGCRSYKIKTSPVSQTIKQVFIKIGALENTKDFCENGAILASQS